MNGREKGRESENERQRQVDKQNWQAQKLAKLAKKLGLFLSTEFLHWLVRPMERKIFGNFQRSFVAK